MAQTFYPITPTEITASAADDWVTMDASAVVPADATGVIVHIDNIKNIPSSQYFGLRKPGSTDNRYSDLSPLTHCWAAIGVDANRYFEAYVENTANIDIYVVGYTMAGVTFKTNADDMSLAGIGDGSPVWQSIDCSTEAPSATGLIFEVINASTALEGGLRKNGSSDDRHNDIFTHSCFGVIIGCDASQICEGYIETTDVDFFLVGYITDGATFNLNATDVSLGANTAWTDLTALPATANMGFIEVISSSGHAYGLRKDGSSEEIYKDAKEHPWGIVEAASLIIEGKIESTNVDFFVVGYSTAVVSVDYPISTSCNLSLTASIDRDIAWNRALSPDLSLATTIDRALAYARATSSNLSLTANISRAMTYARATTSNLSLAVSIAIARGKMITTSTALSLTTSVSRTVAYARASSSSLSLTATVNRVVAYARAISSNLTLATNIVKSWGRTITTSASLSLTTSISRVVAYTRATSSNLSLAVNIVKSWGRTKVISTALSLAASVVKSWNRTISTSSALSLQASVQRVLAYTRASSSNLTLSTSVSRAVAYVRATSSSITLTANVVRTRSIARAISVAISLSATINRIVAYTRATSSAISLTVAINVFIRKLRSITDFTNLRSIVSATIKDTVSFSNLRSIVSATKRTISSFTNLRRRIK